MLSLYETEEEAEELAHGHTGCDAGPGGASGMHGQVKLSKPHVASAHGETRAMTGGQGDPGPGPAAGGPGSWAGLPGGAAEEQDATAGGRAPVPGR